MENLLNLTFVNTMWQIILPLILMVLDVITGYYNAWKSKNIKSSKMRDGIGKKIAEVVYILLGFLFSVAFGLQGISYFICIYIIYMEIMSVAENCKKLGVELPGKLNEKLNIEEKGKKTTK